MALALASQQALNLWRLALTGLVKGDGPDLSARQMAILLSVYLTPSPHTVRGLAANLNVSKPAVVRALDALEALELVRRRRDEQDRRNVLVQRTVRGSVYLSEFGELIADAGKSL